MHSGDEFSERPAKASGADGPAAPAASGIKPHGKDRDTGAALRTVYQETIDEAIPQDLLDLLGKLA